MLTKMVAVFRPGSWSCGRNTDIPVAGQTAALAARALLSNHHQVHPFALRRTRDPLLGGVSRGGGALLKEPLPPFLGACSSSGPRRLRCCLWERPFSSRLGERRYSVIHSFISVHSCSFTELSSPSEPAPPKSSPSQLTPSLQLLRSKP